MTTNTPDTDSPERATAPRRVGQGTSRLPRIVAAALGIVLVVAMVASTKWLGQGQVDALTPKAFDPAAFAAEKFPHIKSTVVTKAVELKELAPAVGADAKAAGAKYCTDAGSGKYDCPVKVTGTVKSVDENWLILDTPDIPGWTVRVPVGPALSGNALRDVTGTIKFGDFTDQTTYQFVADQLRDQARKQVLDPLGDKAKLTGKTLTIYGAWVTGGAPQQFIIQPVQIEAK